MQINNSKVSHPQLSLNLIIQCSRRPGSWVESRITKSRNIQDINNVAEAESLVSAFPKVALKNQVIASLFRHYIDFLAPWYDLNDSQSLFGTLVPQQTMANEILFKAAIAFSACHESRTLGQYQGLGHVYHAACLGDLLEVSNYIHS
jgi:hypothetical protein